MKRGSLAPERILIWVDEKKNPSSKKKRKGNGIIILLFDY
jgi:hypothetical protein